MKDQVSIFILVAFGIIPYFANSQELTDPIISDDVLFEETNGLVAVEAEDAGHCNGAGNNAYVEILPGTRAPHGARNNELAQRFTGPCSGIPSGIPSGLTVELIRDPRFTSIQDPRPEFSWIVPREAVIQKAYQILVSSRKELTEKNTGDVWNSQQVISSQSTGIEFGGEDLKPNTPYYWRVRILDKDNRLSEYSEIQEFTTGSFDQTSVSGNYFQIERSHPKTFIRIKEGYLADFGKDAFATMELNFQAKKKNTLHIRLGEKLLSGRIDPNPGGSVCFQEIELEVSPETQTYLIELIPDQRNTKPGAIALPDSFPVLMPFRYVEIAGTKELEAENLTRVAYFNYFDESASSFSSSNDILDQVWDLSKYSIKATTFSGYYVDGERERIPYEADAYLNQLSHYSVDQEYAMAQKTIEYLMKNPTWPTEWQLHMVFLFYQDYMYTGNTELIEQYYETLKHKTLMALANDKGLISTSSPAHNGGLMKNLGFADTTSRLRDIVDWPQKGGFGGVMGETDGFVFMPVNTVVNSFYYRNMVMMAEFARLLGKTVEALDFQLEAERVKNSLNKQLFNKELGYYVDGVGTDHGSLHANMFPLAFDIVPEGYKKSVASFIKTRGMGCSVYGAQYLLEALYKAGEADYALELLTATHDRSWYNMIRAGSTITMEAWDLKYKPNADWNHAWGAAPANLISRGMWGIQPLTPGFGLVSVKPQMGTLENSTIEVPTIKGKIRAEFERTGPRTAKYVIDLPANMAGEFSMEFPPQAAVILNGEEILLSFGSLPLKPGVNVIEIGINSF
ncbi:MAG: alpha-L-rhamnosidase C-terminal domain-containing protein [Bacteroidales bacterium]